MSCVCVMCRAAFFDVVFVCDDDDDELRELPITGETNVHGGMSELKCEHADEGDGDTNDDDDDDDC